MLSLNSDFESMPFYRFAELIKNPKMRSEIIRGLPYDPTATAEELNHWLALSEKDQFQDYVSGKKTFTQFRSSIASRKFKVKYTVLDDLKPELLPQFKDEELEKQKPLLHMIFNADSEKMCRNIKCVKSMYKQPKDP